MDRATPPTNPNWPFPHEPFSEWQGATPLFPGSTRDGKEPLPCSFVLYMMDSFKNQSGQGRGLHLPVPAFVIMVSNAIHTSHPLPP